jgi:predicted RNase H-like HicB family nuclease
MHIHISLFKSFKYGNFELTRSLLLYGCIDFLPLACYHAYTLMKHKTLTIQEYELPITLHEEDGGFVATCPIWEDCYAQADTLEEAITEISSVAASLIELYHEENMPIPLKLKSTTEKAPSGFTLNFPLIVSSD